MPAILPDLGGEAEIVVPADKFELFAQFHKREKFLGKKYLRRDSAFDNQAVPVIIDGESQTFIISLCDWIDHFSPIAGVYLHAVSLPDPAPFVVMKNAKPDKAV